MRWPRDRGEPASLRARVGRWATYFFDEVAGGRRVHAEVLWAESERRVRWARVAASRQLLGAFASGGCRTSHSTHCSAPKPPAAMHGHAPPCTHHATRTTYHPPPATHHVPPATRDRQALVGILNTAEVPEFCELYMRVSAYVTTGHIRSPPPPPPTPTPPPTPAALLLTKSTIAGTPLTD